MNIFNVSTRKVGGLRFVKVGRFTFMFCVSRAYKSLTPKMDIEGMTAACRRINAERARAMEVPLNF